MSGICERAHIDKKTVALSLCMFVLTLWAFVCIAGWLGYASLLNMRGQVLEYTLMCDEVNRTAMMYIGGKPAQVDYGVWCE